jgi:hypothetical protein
VRNNKRSEYTHRILVAQGGDYHIRNKHLEQLLRKTVFPITLIKHAQQYAEPQNEKAYSVGPNQYSWSENRD